MSVTNEDVSVAAGGNGGGSAALPPTTATSTSSTTVASSTASGNSLSLLNGSISGAATPATTFSASAPAGSTDDVVKSGYLRKLKGKKKFFVLRKETGNDKPARLEYYDKEKKFRTGSPPKKSVVLKACFNISRTDSKCKYSVALHTHNECVRIAMSSEEEMNDWLRVMDSLTREEEEDQVDNSALRKPHFEHIWLVTAMNKGLGSKENIIGPYRLCVTSKEVTLLKVGEHDPRNGVVKFPLSVIRSVSHDPIGCFFHIELGRMAHTGPGQLSLKTEDNNIAQNMHLIIFNAMQNYTKEDLIPRDRESRRVRTYTWNHDQSLGSRTNSFHSSAPPGMPRINSMDGSMSTYRGRTDSVSSALSTRTTGTSGGVGMSPPVPIMSQTPFLAFNSPMCSTGTDSASSSYSIDYDNNNHTSHHHINHHLGSGSQRSSSNIYGGGSSGETGYSKSHDDDESYVPWNPAEDQQPSLGSLTLPLNQDASDYVETSLASKDSSSTAQTPSSYMEMQSPMSPFDNYMPMSPGCGTSVSNHKNSLSGKVSISHSRNSSLIEEHDGYVPMNPTSHNTRCESGGCSTAGSTTGLDDQYLDMDFGRKLNLSNEDVRRMSPASSESIQSGTPSSDFPLEKVSSYLTDDFDDLGSMRPARAYSVGSRSDTSSMGKNRPGKNRLEAVQESRIRAMSVGSKTKRPFVHPNSALFASPVSCGGKSPAPPLSSSWSGSTGRWPPNKVPPSGVHHGQIPVGGHHNYIQPSHAHTGSESNDSDLMELDFSHNKSKSRKRSLPGPNGHHSNTPTGSIVGSSSITKISPIPKAMLAGITGRETPPSRAEGLMEPPKSTIMTTTNCLLNGMSPKYPTSAPISIQKNKTPNDVVTFQNNSPSSTSSILTKMTGMDLKRLKELDDEGAYLDMDFSSNKSSTSSSDTQKSQLPPHQKTNFTSNHHETISNLKNSFLNRQPTPVVVRANESPACKMSRFSLNSPPTTSTLNDNQQHSHHHYHSLSFGGTNSKSETCTTPSSSLVRSLSSSSNLSTVSTHSNSSSNSSMSVKTQQEVDAALRGNEPVSPKAAPTSQTSPLHSISHQHSSSSILSTPNSLSMEHTMSLPPTTSSSTCTPLSRIEEFPEKTESRSSLNPTPLQSPPRSPHHASASTSTSPMDDEKKVTYAAIEHLPPVWRSYSSGSATAGPSSCGSSAVSQAKTGVTYAQIDFVKSTETITPN